MRGCSRRRWTPRPRATPTIAYQPVLIDATYAGLLSGATDAPLVIPALNRDGDCLSDLVLPMFGSIAGAESVLLAFDDDYDTTCAMAEAPHGTAPALLGKDLANPLAMILACGALLRHAADRHGAACERASRAIYEGTLGDDRVGHQDARPGRPRRHHRVHRRGGGADSHQARRLVLAGFLTPRLLRSRGPPARPLADGAVGTSSVRAPPYSYEHMFQASGKRLRALLTLLDDVLGDPEPPAAPHPHRRPVRIQRERRAGTVATRPTHCLSPVPARPVTPRPTRDRVS